MKLTADVRDSAEPAKGRTTIWQAEFDRVALVTAERATEESMDAMAADTSEVLYVAALGSSTNKPYVETATRGR